MTEPLNQHVTDALKKQNLAWPTDEVVRVIRAVQASVDGDKIQASQIIQELSELAQFIEQTKNDIASVRADEIQSKHIPNATDELDAIVGATEEATGAIMDACEQIEALASSGDPAISQQIVDNITKIYEACSFQDITGQRISKIVKALKEIDAKVILLLKTFGADTVTSVATTDDRTGDERLLNGPQLNGQGVSQDDIDRLLNF